MGSSTTADSDILKDKKQEVVKFFKDYIAFYFVLIGAFYATYYVAFTTFLNSIFKQSFFGILAPPKQIQLPPKDLTDSEYGASSYLQLPGVKLHFVQKPINGEEKPLMLLVHGSPDFWFSFREQIKYFSEQYWVIALDLRGSGDSEKPAGLFSSKNYKLDNFTEDIKNFISIVKGNREKVVLVGYEFGGTIVYDFILKYPQLVDKYVTISAVPSYGVGIGPVLIKFWFEYFCIIPFLPEIYLKQHDLDFVDKQYDNETKSIKACYKFMFSKPGTLIYSVNCYRANIITLISRVIFGVGNLKEKNLPYGLAICGEKSDVANAKVYKSPNLIPKLSAKVLPCKGNRIHQTNYLTVNQEIHQFLNESKAPVA